MLGCGRGCEEERKDKLVMMICIGLGVGNKNGGVGRSA